METKRKKAVMEILTNLKFFYTPLNSLIMGYEAENCALVTAGTLPGPKSHFRTIKPPRTSKEQILSNEFEAKPLNVPWRDHFIRFYTQYDPSKVYQVDSLMSKVPNRPDELWKLMLTTYGVKEKETGSELKTKSFMIYVRTLAGNRFFLDVDNLDTVEQVKKKNYRKRGDTTSSTTVNLLLQGITQ